MLILPWVNLPSHASPGSCHPGMACVPTLHPREEGQRLARVTAELEETLSHFLCYHSISKEKPGLTSSVVPWPSDCPLSRGRAKPISSLATSTFFRPTGGEQLSSSNSGSIAVHLAEQFPSSTEIGRSYNYMLTLGLDVKV